MQKPWVDCVPHVARVPDFDRYRVDRRDRSTMQCVLMKALRSKQASDCDMVKLRRQLMLRNDMPIGSQSLSLPESSRALRKPFREATSFINGDILSVVGKRTQLSNVPTKVLLSHVISPGGVSARLKIRTPLTRCHFLHVSFPGHDLCPHDSRIWRSQQSEKAASLTQHTRQQRALEVHLGFFIDWKRKRAWINQYSNGEWGSEQPIYGTGKSFPFRLGELFSLNVTRMPTSMVFIIAGEMVASVHVGEHGAMHAQTPSGAVNQISIQGSAIERAKIMYAEPRWRTWQGVMCANELFHVRESVDGSSSSGSDAAQGPGSVLRIQRQSWNECRMACKDAADTCSGFAYVQSTPAPGTSNVDGRGLCRLQGDLKTRSISACDFREAVNWDLNLRLQQAPARWYNLAMVSPQAKPAANRVQTAQNLSRTEEVQGRRLLDDPLLGWLDTSTIGLITNISQEQQSSPGLERQSQALSRSPVVLPVQSIAQSSRTPSNEHPAANYVRGEALTRCASQGGRCGSVEAARMERSPADGRHIPTANKGDTISANSGTNLGSARKMANGYMETPCVLRESSYSYCGNPTVLTREATDHLMDNLYGAWWVGTCTHDSTSRALQVGGLARLEVDGALIRLGLVPELATEDLVLLRHQNRLLAFASLIEIKSWEVCDAQPKAFC